MLGGIDAPDDDDDDANNNNNNNNIFVPTVAKVRVPNFRHFSDLLLSFIYYHFF